MEGVADILEFASLGGDLGGEESQWLCWSACGQKRAGSGPWFWRNRRRPEQGGFFATRRGGGGQEGIGRCASAAMMGADTEVLRGNRSRWKGAGTNSVVDGFGGKRRDRK